MTTEEIPLSIMASVQGGDVKSGAFWILRTVFQRVSLRVELTVFFMVSFSYDAAVFYDHGAHEGIGIDHTLSLFCQFNGSLHVFLFCVHVLLLLSRG